MNMEYPYCLQEQLSYIYIWLVWTFSWKITIAIFHSSSLIYQMNRFILWWYCSISLFLLRNPAVHPGCVCSLPTDISPALQFISRTAGLHDYLEVEILETKCLISDIENAPRNQSIPMRKDVMTSKLTYLRYESKFMFFHSSFSSTSSLSLGHRGKIFTKQSKSG